MNPPLFASVLLFLGPITVLLGRRIGFLLLFLAGVVGFVSGFPAVVPALTLAFVASYLLFLLSHPDRNPARGIFLWTGLCTLPLWAPSKAWLWALWPGHGLTSAEWNPLADGWFYQKWGSVALLPSPSYISLLISYVGLCALLRFLLLLSGTIRARDKCPTQCDET